MEKNISIHTKFIV